MRRGDIYYVQRRDTVGAETMKARPAVIVSNDRLNLTSTVIEVVYLTTQPKKDMPTHATIQATGTTSTVLCEQIDSVAVQLVGDYCGTCTQEEMNAIDLALLASLGIERQDPPPEPQGSLQTDRNGQTTVGGTGESERGARPLRANDRQAPRRLP